MGGTRLGLSRRYAALVVSMATLVPLLVNAGLQVLNFLFLFIIFKPRVE